MAPNSTTSVLLVGVADFVVELVAEAPGWRLASPGRTVRWLWQPRVHGAFGGSARTRCDGHLLEGL